MKNIIYAVVWLLFSHSIVYCQNDEGIVLINSITNKDIGNNIGATIKFEISKVNCKIRDYEGLKHTPDVINCEVEVNRYDTANRIKSMPYCPNYSDSPSRYTTRIIITVNAIGFETYTEELSYSWEGERPSILRKKIFLIPKKEIVDVNKINNSTESLKVYSAEDIANKLGVTENDIIKLIQEKKLKGKKIGEKYFVRIEDFDAYMKQ